MKQFFAFVRKEFLHIYRDTWTVIILIILPLVMLILFGYALSTEVKKVPFAVYDPVKSSETTAIVSRLSLSEYFELVHDLSSASEIEEVFQRREASMVIVFEAGYQYNPQAADGSSIQILSDGTDPNRAVTTVNYASRIIQSVYAEGAMMPPYSIAIAPRFLYNPSLKSSYNFVPGVMGMILMLVCAMMTSISIAREKEKGTMEVLLVTPMNPLLIILSKVVPFFVLSCINLATILLLAVFLLHVPVAGNLLTLIGISLLYIFVSLAIGLLVSSVANSQIVALLISGMALMMPAMYLSGMMFPIENMPWGLQMVSRIIPARWYIAAMKKVMIMGLGFDSVIKEALILSAQAFALIILSLKKFKRRLE